MAWIYTQAELVAKIKAIDTDIATARQSQEYSYDQGPTGQFGLKKGKIDEMLKEREAIKKELLTYYPNAYVPDVNIVFNEIGYVQG